MDKCKKKIKTLSPFKRRPKWLQVCECIYMLLHKMYSHKYEGLRGLTPFIVELIRGHVHFPGQSIEYVR